MLSHVCDLRPHAVRSVFLALQSTPKIGVRDKPMKMT